jgi:WD40 repeat protein
MQSKLKSASTNSIRHVSSQKVLSIDIQPTEQLISCATNDGIVRMFDVCGKKCLSQFRYTTQLNPSIPPTAMRFHADKVLVGFGNNENQLFAYGVPEY